MGRMVEGTFLKITGRIKEQFKLENGKYVVPAPLEDIFARGPFVQQCYLHGANHVHTVLLVVPNYVELYNYALERDIPDIAELIPYRTKAEVQALASLPLDSPVPEKVQELFRNESFIHLVTSEILRHSVRGKNFECPRMWMPVHLPFAQVRPLTSSQLTD
jgi:long-subunit acyl-CoA synthetase (AMP-forming)